MPANGPPLFWPAAEPTQVAAHQKVKIPERVAVPARQHQFVGDVARNVRADESGPHTNQQHQMQDICFFSLG
jgi:hypothetical protein